MNILMDMHRDTLEIQYQYQHLILANEGVCRERILSYIFVELLLLRTMELIIF